MAASESEQAVVQDDHMYEVEKLISFKKLKNGKYKYWVRWKGYGPQSDTLEPEENLVGCEDMIEDLHTKKARAKRKSRSKTQRDKRSTKMHHMGVLGNKRDCDRNTEPESYTEESSSRSSKDTYWRDFDEGRIDVCNSQDMYSKVKERAARSIQQNDSKKLTVNIHSRDSEELSPKVVIKRNVSIKGRSDEDTYKPPVKVRPVASMTLKRNKKCVTAVGYKKRRLKKKRIYHVDENKHVHEKEDMEALNSDMFQSIKPRTSLYAAKTGKVSLECSGTEIQNSSGCSKVLQELPVNDDGLGQEFTFSLLNSKQNVFEAELPVVQSSKESKLYDNAQLVKTDPEVIKTELDEEPKGIFSEESKESGYSEALSCKVSPDGMNIGMCGTSSDSIYSSVNKMRQATLQKRKFDLWDVIKKEDHEHLKKLLNCGIKWDLEETDSRGLTLLMTAACNGSVEAVKILCANGAYINAANSSGTTALMLVCEKGLYDVAKTLLELNAHKDIQNNNGETALMLACHHCKPKIVELLLQYGANFGLMNKDGINALRISNQYAKDTITPILNLHISQMVMVFENKVKEVVQEIAEIKYALFPIQCFSLNEGPTFKVTFQHHVKKELPEKGYLLFIAHTSIDVSSITCSFQGVSSVLSVRVNGHAQESLRKNDNFVFKMSCFVSGNNEVLITTAHNAQSEVKLVVCAYRVYYKLNCAQSNTLEDSQSTSDPFSLLGNAT